MISKTRGNIIQADVEALVNTVNCAGYMGKGIALQFKQAFPENFKSYTNACRNMQVQPGKMFVFTTNVSENPKYIINFPTKRHWKEKSRLEDIEKGLIDLVLEVQRLNIKSIAIPPLGCGLGGLNWKQVKPLIENSFSKISDVTVLLFEPSSEVVPTIINTEKPKMTNARALFIKLMNQYKQLDYRLSLLEIQKLGYFLQEAGEPLRLKYEAGTYGPYAHNLNKVLEILEGHFITGYNGNLKPNAEIELVSGAIEEAENFLLTKDDSLLRLKRIADLIEGFETPYGMELLSSVHWVHKHNAATSSEEAIATIHHWNERKRKLLKEEHIQIAWNQLKSQGWLY